MVVQKIKALKIIFPFMDRLSVLVVEKIRYLEPFLQNPDWSVNLSFIAGTGLQESRANSIRDFLREEDRAEFYIGRFYFHGQGFAVCYFFVVKSFSKSGGPDKKEHYENPVSDIG